MARQKEQTPIEAEGATQESQPAEDEGMSAIRTEVQQLTDEIRDAQRPIQDVLDKLEQARNEAKKSPRLLTAQDFQPAMLPLPSGGAVEVRPVDVEALALSGTIPNALKETAFKVAQSQDATLLTDDETVDKSAAEVKQMELEAEERYRAVLDIMTLNVVTNPRLVATQEDEAQIEDSVWVGRIPYSDKRYLLFYLTAPAVAFAAFRTE